ncbi:substrate-binding domain-containing protein [bacterium]|nr:substrate-binding domain-containing protein [bacterium]
MRRISCLLLLCIMAGMLDAQEPMIIITNADMEIESIDASTLRNIFLGKKTKWDDGKKISPVTIKSGEIYELFLSNIVRKSSHAFDNYWRQRIYTGKGAPPVQFKNEQEVIRYIERTPGSIGYVSSQSVENSDNQFRVIKVKK